MGDIARDVLSPSRRHTPTARQGGNQDLDYDPKRKRNGSRLNGRALSQLHCVATAVCGALLLAMVLARQLAHATPPQQQQDLTAAAALAAEGAAGTGRRQQAGQQALPTLPSPPPPLLSGSGGGAAGVVAQPSRADLLLEQRIERAMRLRPLYRGVGRVEVFPAFANANRLLLASHGRLLWYRYDTDEVQVLHEGQGVYYGVFPGEERDLMGAPSSVWVVSRPHNWHPTDSQEWLLRLGLENGTELGRVATGTRFTHDAVRRRDKVYLCSTGDGRVLELDFPSMAVAHELPLFSKQEHPNTLAPRADGRLWVLLHNLGPSELAEVDVGSGQVVRRLQGVGTKSHGLVQWEQAVLLLDSEAGELLHVDVEREGSGTAAVKRLWQLGEADKFLKGLCVVDDIAFFGIAERRPRQEREDPTLDCELAAFDLSEGVLLWRRRLPTHGLLNVVSAPHLAVESTSWALTTQAQASYRAKPAYQVALQAALQAGSGQRAQQHQQQQGTGGQQHQQQGQQEGTGGGGQQQAQAAVGVAASGRKGSSGDTVLATAAGVGAAARGGAPVLRRALSELEQLPPEDPLTQYPPLLDPVRWSSGLPRLGLASKRAGLAGGVQLRLLRANLSALAGYVAGLPEEDWSEDRHRISNVLLEGRQGNLNAIKPGTQSIHLAGESVFRFPWYDRFKQWVEPLLLEILGERDVANVIRLQLARMPPNSEIKQHVDSGGYAEQGHRIHIVLLTNPGVTFNACEHRAASRERQGGGGAGGNGVRRSQRRRHGLSLQGQQQQQQQQQSAEEEEAAVGVVEGGTEGRHLLQQQQQQQQRQQQRGGAGGGEGEEEGPNTCVPIHVEAGLVFELNNHLPHTVRNGGSAHRVHLVVDVAEYPRQQRLLAVGEACSYLHGRIECGGSEGQQQQQQVDGGGG